MDEDGDGAITLNEMQATARRRDVNTTRIDIMKYEFKRFDKDGDHKLSLEEVANFRQELLDRMLDADSNYSLDKFEKYLLEEVQDAEEYARRLDKNNDGKIDMTEFAIHSHEL